jgi:amylosucrase
MDFDTLHSLQRLVMRLSTRLKEQITADPPGWQAFTKRLDQHFPALFTHLRQLYGGRYDFFYYLEELVLQMATSWFERPITLRQLDLQREADPDWFQSNHMLGGVMYVDLFAGDLAGVRHKIPYLQELGLSYLHLMPLFKTRTGENDGGYAVSDYRSVNSSLGTMNELRTLTRELHKAGISLVLDFVLNHTSEDHPWAIKARAGDPLYRQLYYIFPDRSQPDAYERHLREIFPDEHPGAFSPLRFPPNQNDGTQEKTEWVWTTFHSYQWDLNYTNPATFNEMAAEMLFLANIGVSVLRLDALAFTWKEIDTTCESLPQVHTLMRAYNAVARIAAPGLLFKSEAIVHPDQVISYISAEECQLSYNPLLMAMLWNSLATRQVDLLEQAMVERRALPPGTAWVNYVRCHDDIGWTFSDEDAARLGVKGSDHRKFLNAFYTGRFPGSFAHGLPFQENPKTGDCRVSGTCASLAGLEKALNEEGMREVELAIRRILLLHGVILTSGGIPLIYLGDEIGQRNDYRFQQDPAKAHDSRWVHRLPADPEKYTRRYLNKTVEGRIYTGLQGLIALRNGNTAFAGLDFENIPTQNPHVLGYSRINGGQSALIFANFSDFEQNIPRSVLADHKCLGLHRLHGFATLQADRDLVLEPFDFFVLG